MITLRLFKSSDPFLEIESRPLGHEAISLGRDASADWHILDPERLVSRRHCIFSMDRQRVFVRDVSTAGMFIGVERRSVPHGERIEVAAGETIHVGPFMILVDAAEMRDADTPLPHVTPQAVLAPTPARFAKTDHSDAAMLEAFCRGAGLDASSFAGEDPAAVMTRIGAIYRQVIDEVSGMIRERAAVRNELRMDRTTIASRDNNPLKWAPTHRVAVDLLKEDGSGFLKGAAAFKASFSDLRRHSVCLMAGSDAAIHHLLTELDPEALETSSRRASLPFASKYEAAWKAFRDRHDDLSGEASDSVIDRAFRNGYERRLTSLEDEEEAA